MLDIFAERLIQRRKELKLTQTKLAAAVGLDQRQISSYENALHVPAADTVARLATALDTSADWLLGRTNTHPENDGNAADALNPYQHAMVELMAGQDETFQRHLLEIARHAAALRGDKGDD
jgi:transcriptional regulator with XRE-family HTH domain